MNMSETYKFNKYIKILSTNGKLTPNIVLILLVDGYNIEKYTNIFNYDYNDIDKQIFHNYLSIKQSLIQYMKANNLLINRLNKKQHNIIYRHIIKNKELIKGFTIKYDMRTCNENGIVYIKTEMKNRMILLKKYISINVVAEINMTPIKSEDFINLPVTQQLSYYNNLINKLKIYYNTNLHNIVKYKFLHNLLSNKVKNLNVSIKEQLYEEFNIWLNKTNS